MKKVLVIILIVFTQSAIAQDVETFSIFHRLLILNSENEILTVRIKNTDFWVTPGFYQNSEQSVKEGLESMASAYGIKTEMPELKGVFTLKRELKAKKSSSIRNVYTAKVVEEELIMPNGVDEIKWLAIDEATALITFPHISLIMSIK